jgi:adenylylsulfate kinase-like enzyme
VVIVITGPIASGKSTVARELARELERTHVRVAVIDLDLLHDMLARDTSAADDATGAVARHAAATLANTFRESGVTVVVAEGSFNTPDARAAFTRHLDAIDEPLFVTLRVSYEEALRRAQGDPTRGRSRDPAFLGRYFSDVSQAVETVPATDLVIETEEMPASAAAAAIASRFRQSPSSRARPAESS